MIGPDANATQDQVAGPAPRRIQIRASPEGRAYTHGPRAPGARRWHRGTVLAVPARSTSIFPDLTPPPGWIGVPLAPQVRLIPPGTTLETARAAIIVSPIAARTPVIPPPAQLIAAAIAAESRHDLDVLAVTGPDVAASDFGLEGIAFHVHARAPHQVADQRRIYVVYSDDKFMYGINYMSSARAYDEHLVAFWKTARSIRPFQGRVVPPSPPPSADVD